MRPYTPVLPSTAQILRSLGQEVRNMAQQTVTLPRWSLPGIGRVIAPR